MVNLERPGCLSKRGELVERYQLTRTGTHSQPGQHVRVAVVFRFNFNDQPVLISRSVDDGDLASCISTVQSVLNSLHGNAQTGAFIAIDLNVYLQRFQKANPN